MSALDASIQAQGDKVRALKAAKASKDEIGAEVKVLLDLKAKYKAETGSDWKPGAAPPTPAPASTGGDLNARITEQGDAVRKLKAEKADKDKVSAAVKVLLDLKAEYKTATGQDWKPAPTPAPAAAKQPPPPKEKTPEAPKLSGKAAEIDAKIKEQGDKVRELKGSKADKAAVEAAVKELLQLKAEFKAETGGDWKPAEQGKKEDKGKGKENKQPEKKKGEGEMSETQKKREAKKAEKAAKKAAHKEAEKAEKAAKKALRENQKKREILDSLNMC